MAGAGLRQLEPSRGIVGAAAPLQAVDAPGTSMARSVDYDQIAKTYDRRYQWNDYSGVEAALIAFVGEHFDQRVLEIDRRRYPASSQIREWMRAAGFAECVTREIQRLPVRLGARAALEQGRLDKSATSQLSVLTDEEYRQGVDRVREALESAEVRGESLSLNADLRLYATFGAVPA